MDFAFSDRCLDYRDRLLAFMDERIYPTEARLRASSCRDAATRTTSPPVMEELKADARARGLWNLFQPHPEWGPGLTNVEYAPLAEIMGRSRIASEACNCSAPDTGNMEVLTMFGTAGAAGPVAAPAARRRDPVRVRDDRARRRLLGRHEHLAAHRARRRRLRPQRPQVVDRRRACTPTARSSS